MFTKSARYYDALYSWKDYDHEVEQLHGLIQQRCPGAATLLDVACGTGMHLERLKCHYAVEGIDLDPEMLTLARSRLPDVQLHQGDMTSFDLGKQFDVVVCLFSSIGYAGDKDALKAAIARMAQHLRPNGVLVVEPWFTPGQWETGSMHALFVDEPDIKIARISDSSRDGSVSILNLHYLVGSRNEGIAHFEEEHRLMLFMHEEYLAAFDRAGLVAEHDPEGLMGRGLYLGSHPVAG